MGYLFTLINAAACGLISMVLIAAIVSPRVHDGVIVKIGLIGLASGFGSISLKLLEGMDDLGRPLMLVNSGMTVVIIGYLMRRARTGHAVRRLSDWFTHKGTR